MILSSENIEKNYEIFLKKMEEIGISKETIEKTLGTEFKNSTFTIDTQSNLAYEGSLINVVLRKLIPTALKLNDVLNEKIRVSRESIIKIGLLQHLSKSRIFAKNTDQWQIDKLGKLFTYAPNKLALRMGARSLAIAFELGIQLTEQEVEAILIIDKDQNDEQAKYYATPLSVIIRQANELILTDAIFNKE